MIIKIQEKIHDEFLNDDEDIEKSYEYATKNNLVAFTNDFIRISSNFRLIISHLTDVPKMCKFIDKIFKSDAKIENSKLEIHFVDEL